MSIKMCANYWLSFSVWCVSGSQICKILKIKTVHSKNILAVISNFLDYTL